MLTALSRDRLGQQCVIADLEHVPQPVGRVGTVGHRLDAVVVARDAGTVQPYEEGNYYAIVSGNGPNEIVGVLVLENSAEYDNATVRDTSGFIVYRDPAATP